MFDTRKELSDFTQKALDGHVKEVSRLTGMSKTDLYAIMAGQRADHLDYARDIHRALCLCNPAAAEEYRNLLAADRDLTAAPKAHAEGSDELEIKRLCDGLTTALHMDEDSRRAAMVKLHAYLSGRLKTVYGPAAHLRNVG